MSQLIYIHNTYTQKSCGDPKLTKIKDKQKIL